MRSNKSRTKKTAAGTDGNGFFARVYGVVKEIPPGKVATYGQIACLLGAPRMARQVGYALRAASRPELPGHRVVNRFGGLAPAFAFGSQEAQAALLAEEGVTAEERECGLFVELSRFLWDGVPLP